METSSLNILHLVQKLMSIRSIGYHYGIKVENSLKIPVELQKNTYLFFALMHV